MLLIFDEHRACYRTFARRYGLGGQKGLRFQDLVTRGRKSPISRRLGSERDRKERKYCREGVFRRSNYDCDDLLIGTSKW